ncbi:MAG: hypothetical protein L0220_20365 [Acidobacteria bacterium]|nr:hypothetical protein [Acidobacteriota bacterium]
MITKKNLVFGSFLVFSILFAVGWGVWKSSTKAKQYDGMKLIVNDLSQYGIELIDSSNAAFNKELSVSFSIPSDLLNEVTRYSVIVKNRTPQNVISLTVVWRFYPSKGEPITKTYVARHSNSPVFYDPTKGLIKPNGRYAMCLLLPSAGISVENAQGLKQEIKNDDKLQNQLAHLNGLIARSVKWSVDVDGVLFSNGIYVGPDSSKTFDRLNARIKGARDLIEELMQKLNNNQSNAEVLAHAKPLAEIKDADLRAEYPSIAQKHHDLEYTYKLSKIRMARQIVARQQRFGDQSAIDDIKQSSQSFIPMVKKSD